MKLLLVTCRCLISSAYSFQDFDAGRCLALDAARPNVLIMGDSHAAHLWSRLAERYPDVKFMQATTSGCKPVLTPDPAGSVRCLQMMHFLFQNYLPHSRLNAVVLAASWDPADIGAVSADLDWLRARGITVILAGPTVRYQAPLPQILAMAPYRSDPALIDRARKPDGAALDHQFAQLAASHGAAYFSTYQVLCESGTCRTLDGAGLPVQFDYGHLTHAESLLVADHFPMSLIRKGAKSGL